MQWVMVAGLKKGHSDLKSQASIVNAEKMSSVWKAVIDLGGSTHSKNRLLQYVGKG